MHSSLDGSAKSSAGGNQILMTYFTCWVFKSESIILYNILGMKKVRGNRIRTLIVRHTKLPVLVTNVVMMWLCVSIILMRNVFTLRHVYLSSCLVVLL